MSALMIARITVKDAARFQEYLAQSKQLASGYGAELVHRGKVGSDLTGEARDHELVVIAKFPSLRSIEEWYGSEAYQPLKALRDEGAEMRMTSYDVME